MFFTRLVDIFFLSSWKKLSMSHSVAQQIIIITLTENQNETKVFTINGPR